MPNIDPCLTFCSVPTQMDALCQGTLGPNGSTTGSGTSGTSDNDQDELRAAQLLEISEKEPKALASSSKHKREWNQLVTSQAIQ